MRIPLVLQINKCRWEIEVEPDAMWDDVSWISVAFISGFVMWIDHLNSINPHCLSLQRLLTWQSHGPQPSRASQRCYYLRLDEESEVNRTHAYPLLPIVLRNWNAQFLRIWSHQCTHVLVIHWWDSQSLTMICRDAIADWGTQLAIATIIRAQLALNSRSRPKSWIWCQNLIDASGYRSIVCALSRMRSN